MTKKCIGCGVNLQNKDINKMGYTPNIDNDYCQRCFKITHYNEKIDIDLKVSNDELIEKINNKNKYVIFLCDFLNIYNEIIELYKSIKCDKVFVITKSDIIPKNIIKNKVINNIRNVYDIKEDIILCSVKIKENLSIINHLIESKKEVIMVGPTNGGKSSLINTLMGTNITVSKNSNTTLDFIKLNFDKCIIYDTPGFVPSVFLDSLTPKGYIKPISYQLKSKYYLKFLDINFSSNIDNNITMYLNNMISVDKRKIIDNIKYDIKVRDNSDLIIKGLGFINIKKECFVSLNISKELIEVRPSIVGGSHE